MYPDVVIVGGGIIGCSCAYYLSLEGLRVHLVERGPLLYGASKAGETQISAFAGDETGIDIQLALESARLYATLSEELPLDIEYEKVGTIGFAESEEDFQWLTKAVRQLADVDDVRYELLTFDELARWEPVLAQSSIAGAVFFPDEPTIQPHLAALGLARVAMDHGALIQTFAEVTGFELSASSEIMAVNTTAGKIPTKVVVCAAGAWSGIIGRMIGLNLPIRPCKGQIVVTQAVPRIFNHRVVMEAAFAAAIESSSGDTTGRQLAITANIHQTARGNLLLGSSGEYVGFDCRVDPEVIMGIVARNLRFVPGLGGVHAIRAYAGLRPYTLDGLPVIGEVDQVRGFYIAAGHQKGGITRGPITGKLIGQLILGQEPDLPLTELSPARFLHSQDGD